MQVDYIKSSAKQVKLFNRAKKSVNKTISYEKSDEDEIDGLKNLVEKATKKRIEEQKDEEQKLLNNLKSLSDQIKATKEEYESVIAELMPVKWELVEKKTQISELQSDYEALLSRIKQAKLELDSLDTKMNMEKI
ncbi:MAG: hypothetical protein AABW60_02475 [Thermoproteota archaeon]